MAESDERNFSWYEGLEILTNVKYHNSTNEPNAIGRSCTYTIDAVTLEDNLRNLTCRVDGTDLRDTVYIQVGKSNN